MNNNNNNKFPGLDVDIKEVQKVELQILLEFDRICKKNNINYQLFAGTLLGAIRHKGFIPWDDDIDVCMLRKDYEEFVKACKTDLNTKYFLQTYRTDPNYNTQFAKIRKNNTIFTEKATSKCKIHQGIYIDIFPLDNVPMNTIGGKIQQQLMYIIGRINLCRIKILCLNVKSPMKRYISIIFHYLLKVIPKVWTDKLQTKIACMFNNKNTKHVGELSLSTTKELYDRFTIERSIFYDSIEWDFEGYKFPIPRDYDYVLTKNYGDYMTPPLPEQQKPHHGIIEICFDTTSKT